MKEPKVSVLLGVLNQEKYLPLCIESVLCQTFSDFEFIILNDGSTDRTWEIIQQYAQKDSRIRPFSFPEKQGIAVGCNFTVAKSKGEYLARIDGDDIWEPEKLAMQVEYLDRHPECGVCFSQAKIIDREGKIISGAACNGADQVFTQENKSQSQWLRQLVTSGNCLNHPSSVIRRSALEAVGGYSSDFQQFPDFDLWLRLIQICPFHILPEKLIRYRYLKESTSILGSETACRISQEYFQIYLHLFDHTDRELFIQAFQDLFLCPDSSSQEELQCEKAFLLLHHSFGVLPEPGKLAALTLLHQLLNQKSTRKLLWEKYHFNQFDYFRLGGQPLFYSYPLYFPDSLLRKKIEACTATLFYSQDQHLDADHCLTAEYQTDQGVQTLTFSLPVEGIQTLRFDPMEGYPCVVWHFHALLNGAPLQAVPANARLGSAWYFITTDPQIHFSLSQPIQGTLEIQIGITPLPQLEENHCVEGESDISVSWQRYRQALEQLDQKDRQLTQKEEQLTQQAQQLEAVTQDRNALRNQLDRIYQTTAYRAYAKLRHLGKK